MTVPSISEHISIITSPNTRGFTSRKQTDFMENKTCSQTSNRLHQFCDALSDDALMTGDSKVVFMHTNPLTVIIIF